jgi:hypothetical protein
VDGDPGIGRWRRQERLLPPFVDHDILQHHNQSPSISIAVLERPNCFNSASENVRFSRERPFALNKSAACTPVAFVGDRPIL